jgi:hypothetical protein
MTAATNNRLSSSPWLAIAGELISAAGFGVLTLFFPFASWVTFPQLLSNAHFALATVFSLAIGVALARRRRFALRLGILVAAIIGLPNLAFWSQVLGLLLSTPERSSFMFWLPANFIGYLGQFLVLVACLYRLRPIDA